MRLREQGGIWAVGHFSGYTFRLTFDFVSGGVGYAVLDGLATYTPLADLGADSTGGYGMQIIPTCRLDGTIICFTCDIWWL